MSEERLRRIQELHARALEKSGADREAYLTQECGEDRQLRAEVVSLLRARESMGDFLEHSAVERLEVLAADRVVLEAGQRVGQYEIVRELGRGGAGTVYEALQAHPHRRVALKLMHADLGSGAARGRFEEEAEILARLQHPGIAHVYEAGVHAVGSIELPYFAMEYIEGGQTVVRFVEAVPVRARLELAARICDAIHHGHQKGVIHRDIKPGNVLVDASGQPKVIDFGIARVAGPDARPDGELVGTLAYMSPERLRRGDEGSDVRSDVYALGVLLYEMLTGRLPYGDRTEPLSETARKIREDEPAPLSQRDRKLRGDIEAIVGKAIDRERDRRYPSASALASDLRRYLEHRPVEAHPPALVYPLLKFARRRLGLFLALTAMVVVAVAAAIIGSWLALQKEQQRREAEFQAYVAGVAGAAAALRSNDVAEARQCLERTPEELRGWEWHHLSGRLDASLSSLESPVYMSAGAMSRDARVIAAGGYTYREALLVIWRRSGGAVNRTTLPARNSVGSMAFHPDGSELAVGYGDGVIEIRAVADGEIRRRLECTGGAVNELAYDPAGVHLASGSSDGVIRFWRDGTQVRTLSGHSDRVIGLDFDPSGALLASGGRAGEIRIWQVATGSTVRTLTGHTGSVEGVAFSPDGLRLASCSRDETVRIWEVETGRQIAIGRGHTHNVRSVDFAPDGESVATASYDRTVRLWDADDATALATLRGHTGVIRTVVYGGDDRLFSWGRDGAVKEWHASKAKEQPELTGHADLVLDAAFSPDGRLIATASRDGTARLWDHSTRRLLAVLDNRRGPVQCVAFFPDGKRLLSGSRHQGLRVWSAPDGDLLQEDRGFGVVVARFSPDGRRLFLATSRGLELRGPDDLGLLGGPVQEKALVRSLAIERRGRVLASGDAEGNVRLHDPTTLDTLTEARVHEAQIKGLAFSPDGRRLVSASLDGTIRILDARTLEPVGQLEGITTSALQVVYSGDGTRIASGLNDCTVRLHDALSGRQVLVLRGHRHPVYTVTFSPDGRCLATGEGGWEIPGVVKLWSIPE